MDTAAEIILQKFDGKLIGKQKLKKFVCKTVLLFPKSIQDYVTKNCWFMGSMEDAWAYTFTGNDLKNQHLVFLSDELMEQEDTQIQYSIAHEIGHVILKHRNSVVAQQTAEEIERQELEADNFAIKYVTPLD